MKSPSQLFYLGVFAIWGSQVQCLNSQDDCAISPRSIVSDACASYSTLERLNRKIKPPIDDLTHTTDFFSHYRLNLFHKTCPFWNDENGMCGNIACAVETLDNEQDIPEVWRASELGKLEGPRAKHPAKTVQRERPEKPLQGDLGEGVGESCVVEYDDECDDRDYCVPEDESAAGKGDYVSLLKNPERFTGYAGAGAAQVWDAIYRENCFQRSSFPHSAQLGVSQMPKGPAAMDFRSVLEAAGRQQVLEERRAQNPNTPFVAKTGLENEDECLEKRVFHRVMSGMHASISTHLCWNFLNQTTGEWTPNLACYEARLHRFPDRISNLYFNYALVTRAVAKLGPHLRDYTFCTGDKSQDDATHAKVLSVTEEAASVPQTLDESLMFKNGEGPSLKEDFRNRFRNVSRLMDCVGCDKCRLWGKLQTAGYGAALKVLFESDNDSGETPVLKRTELVALFNTYGRLSSSLDAIVQFRQMLQEREENAKGGKKASDSAPSATSSSAGAVVKDEKIQPIPTRAKKPHHVVDVPEEKASQRPDVVHEAYEESDDTPRPISLSEAFNEEFGMFLKAFKIVIKSWIRLPVTFYEIITSELKRLWQFYIGLPVSPRTWKFSLPDIHEEL